MKHVVTISTLYPNPATPRFGTFVARSMEALTKHSDWRVTVVNPIGIPPVAVGRYRALAQLEDQAEEGGIAIHRPRFTLIPKVGARRNGSTIAKAALPLIERIHAQTPIDVIDAQFFFPDGPAAARVAKAMGLPLSIKARGSDITFWGKQDFALEQMLRAADAADGLLSVSEALKRDMVALGMPADKIGVHYTGLDRDRFRPLDHTQLRSQIGKALGFAMPHNSPLLVCVGALLESKGQQFAIGALPAIPGARLVLVGTGEDEAKFRGLARDLAVSERVHFTGSIDHDLLPLILSAADVMVLPSEREGLANAWVEALACGTPVVTTDVGGAREIITEDAAGCIVERNSRAIADGVNTVLNAPASRLEVARFADQFSWEANAQTLARHYDTLSRGA